MSLVLWVFGHKSKYWTNYYFKLMIALNEKLKDHQSYNNSSSGSLKSAPNFIAIHPIVVTSFN